VVVCFIGNAARLCCRVDEVNHIGVVHQNHENKGCGSGGCVRPTENLEIERIYWNHRYKKS
jgi:hypothetical protein